MSKKGILVGGIVATAIIGIIASFSLSQFDTETVNLDMGRTHGTISTAMGSAIAGDLSAPVTIVEFGDYQCSNCKKWYHNTMPQIYENYIETGKANLVFVDLAFLGKDSRTAAEASYCAEDQGKYWEYHDLLYLSQQGVDDGWANSERLKAFAFSLELDMDLFSNCLDSGKFSKRVQYNYEEAGKQGANATPTFFIVNSEGKEMKIAGAQPYSVFKNVLDSMI